MIKDFLINKDINKLNYKIFDNEWSLFEDRVLDSNDIYNLKISRITKREVDSLNEKDLMAAYIYYLMNNGYYYEEKIIKSNNITNKEIAYISENYSDLGGFNIKYNWERVYLYGDTFRSLLGNISNISIEDKNYYLDLGFSLNEIVGSSFI